MKVVRRYRNRRYGRECFSVLEKIQKIWSGTVHTKEIKMYIYSSGISFFSLYPGRKLYAGLKEKHRKNLIFYFFLITINL